MYNYSIICHDSAIIQRKFYTSILCFFGGYVSRLPTLVKTLSFVVIVQLITIGQVSAISPSQLQSLNNMSSAQKAKLAAIATGSRATTINRSTLVPPTKVPDKAKNQLKDAKQLEEEVPKVPLLEVGSHIIIYFDQKKDETKPRKFAIDNEPSEFTPSQPQLLFQLDHLGEIKISGIGKIALAGLTDMQAAARINLEPLLQQYSIKVLLLPLRKFGLTELKPFGYELFKEMPEQMGADSSMPVPKDYVVGPGDQIHIQLLGKENEEHLLEISRDSTLSIPGIGTFPVSGLNFDELKRDIKKRIKKQLIGVDAFVSLGQLRSIRIFVLGEVEKPGSYSVSGLSTMTSALMFGEGVTDIGSLRHIVLKRSGNSVGILDLYNLLLKGDNQQDIRLQPGDVIHVPTIKRSVSIGGEVRRPAIYELNKESKLIDMLALAGGLLPTAIQGNIKIERVEGVEKKLIELNLKDKTSQNFAIQAGDVITVDSVLDRQENTVTLNGEVMKPSTFQWTPALKISDIIPNIRSLRPQADSEYVLIKRYPPPEFKLQIITSNLTEIFLNKNSNSNISLQPRDEILVFSLDDKRILQIKPVVEQLISQADSTEHSKIVRVTGMIRGPGRYPLVNDMRIADLVNAGGRLTESAYTLDAELTRYISKPGKPREIIHRNINLHEALSGNEEANLLLEPYDLLNIKEIPLWQEEDRVELVGEINFPGEYAIQRGETLRDLIKRAGGVTKFSYPPGAVFIREDLRKREQERLDAMAANLEAELATISLERSGDPTKIQSAGTANQLLTKLKGTEAAGRLVIDLQQILDSEDKNRPIFLRGGDKLFVPSKMQEISVIGQVFHPTSHLFNENLSVDEYIELSGGTSRTADNDNIYVVRANGAVQSAKSSWAEDELELLPGDTVVVPLDADRISNLKLWTDVSQILYQLGLSAAAWNTVGLFQ